MNNSYLTEVSRIHDLMGVISEQTIQDIKSGNGILKQGSKGESVELIQNMLGIEADGKFGPKTKEAVEKFQQDNGLKVDGVVGKNTLSKMNISDETTGSDSVDAKSAGYNLGVLFGEGVKKFVVTIGKTVFYIIITPAVVTYMIGEKIYTTTVEFGKKVLNMLRELGTIVVKEVVEFSQNVVRSISTGLKKLGIAIEKGYEAVKDGLSRLGNQIVLVVKTVLLMIKNLGEKIYAQALALGAKVFSGIKSLLSWMGQQWETVKNVVKQTWNNVVTVAKKGVDWLKQTGEKVYNQASDFWDGLTSVFESYDRTENLIMEMSIYSLLSEMEHNPKKNTLLI